MEPSGSQSSSSSSDLYLQLKSQKFRYEIDYLEECLPAAERIEKQFKKLQELYTQEGQRFEKLSLEFHNISQLPKS